LRKPILSSEKKNYKSEEKNYAYKKLGIFHGFHGKFTNLPP